MLENAVGGMAALLAVLGAVALVYRLVRAAARLALRAAEVTAASGLAEISARRGDLTGMAERRAAEQEARQARRRAGALTVLWLTWVVLPPMLGWAAEAYALAAILWLLPTAPLRPRTPPPG